MIYIVEIRNGKKSTKTVKNKLERSGFCFIKTGKYSGYWKKETEKKKELRKWRRFCRFKFEFRGYEKDFHERGKFYRSDYFRLNQPDAFGKYHCAYCGKRLKKEKIQVDHLIPVAMAQRSRYWQWQLKKHCNGNVNHPNNLVGACEKCNTEKGSKTSFWIVRGKIGKHYSFFIFLNTIYIFLILFLLYLIFNEIGYESFCHNVSYCFAYIKNFLV